MARYPDPHARLGLALTNMSGGELIESRQTPWASATFSGARHQFIFLLPESGHAAPLGALNEREFELPGHVLADIELLDCSGHPDCRRVTIDALTVEDV
ncbi:MAG: hypothetical protein AB7G25_13665 [Sphingomonadaceae bacterium]